MPHHESPDELRLWAIIDSLVTDISEKEAYLAFAHELMVAECHRQLKRQTQSQARAADRLSRDGFQIADSE